MGAVTEPVAYTLGGATEPAGETLAPAGQALGGVTQPIGSAVKPLTQPVAEAASQVITPVFEVAGPLTEPAGKAFGNVAGPSLEPIVEATVPVAAPVKEVVGPVTPVLKPVKDALAPDPDRQSTPPTPITQEGGERIATPDPPKATTPGETSAPASEPRGSIGPAPWSVLEIEGLSFRTSIVHAPSQANTGTSEKFDHRLAARLYAEEVSNVPHLGQDGRLLTPGVAHSVSLGIASEHSQAAPSLPAGASPAGGGSAPGSSSSLSGSGSAGLLLGISTLYLLLLRRGRSEWNPCRLLGPSAFLHAAPERPG